MQSRSDGVRSAPVLPGRYLPARVRLAQKRKVALFYWADNLWQFEILAADGSAHHLIFNQTLAQRGFLGCRRALRF